MDKQTLSNYGWVIITVLVLAVMIALATPFGSYVKEGVNSTVNGIFSTEEKSLNVIGLSAIPDIDETAKPNCEIVGAFKKSTSTLRFLAKFNINNAIENEDFKFNTVDAMMTINNKAYYVKEIG